MPRSRLSSSTAGPAISSRSRPSFPTPGVEVGDITHPFYMPAGELRVIDPDGYVVLVGRLS